MLGSCEEGRFVDIPDEIRSIGDMINGGNFSWVDRIVIDQTAAEAAPPVLNEEVLQSGEPLRSNIGQISVSHLSGPDPIAVYVLLIEWVMDRNTIRAVWAINNRLRPAELATHWTVDRLFLLHVGLEYEAGN